MGKGDVKTKKGKIAKGTYGVRRPRSANKSIVVSKKAKAKPAKTKAKVKPKTEETAGKAKAKATKKEE